MDTNLLNGILRAVLPSILAFAVGKGWLTDSSAADVTAAAVAVMSAIWSVISNQTKAQDKKDLEQTVVANAATMKSDKATIAAERTK